jgi:hypothetical protein
MTTTGLPGAGCNETAGGGVCRRKPSRAKRIAIVF